MLGRYKPWSFEDVPFVTHNLTDYLNMVCYELSPFFEAAQPFASNLHWPAWLRRRTLPARILNLVFGGNVALRGLPLAIGSKHQIEDPCRKRASPQPCWPMKIGSKGLSRFKKWRKFVTHHIQIVRRIVRNAGNILKRPRLVTAQPMDAHWSDTEWPVKATQDV